MGAGPSALSQDGRYKPEHLRFARIVMVFPTPTLQPVSGMRRTLTVLLCSGLACISFPTVAQYDAGATQMLGQGMGFGAYSSSTYRNSIEATKDKRGSASTKAKRDGRADNNSKKDSAKTAGPALRSQADVDRYMNARMAYHARALQPEYKRRAARDGQAAADKWIRAKGEELGKMEGERARKLVVRD